MGLPQEKQTTKEIVGLSPVHTVGDSTDRERPKDREQMSGCQGLGGTGMGTDC